jgi:hypothetical protein
MNKDTQSWSNSNLTEMDELLQKVQQLERENAALREDRELLNFLLKRGVCWRDCDKELEGEYWTVGHETEWLHGLDRGRERIRAAIDAEMRAEEGQP